MAPPERVGHAARVAAPVPAAGVDPRAAGGARADRDRQGMRAAEPRVAPFAAGWSQRQPVLPLVGDSRQQRTGRQLRRRAGDDRRARRAAPRRPQAAWGGARAGLPADRAGDRDRRRHRRTAAQQPAGGVRDRPEPGAGAAGTPRQRQDDGAVAGHRGPLGRERALRHLVGAAETQRRGAARSLRAGGEPDPGNRLPDAHRRGHRRGRAADATGREPRETRRGHSERGRAREASVEGPRRGGVRRGPRTPARPGRRRGGRQRGRREAGGAAPGGLPPPAGPRAGHRRRDGEDAPAGVGEGPGDHPRRDIPRTREPRLPRRACWPPTACRRGWSSTASSSTRRRT